MAWGEIVRVLSIPNNYRVGLQVTVRSACFQRVHVSVNGHPIGTWEGNGRRELFNGPLGSTGQVTFLVRIEHNCVTLRPKEDRWAPNEMYDRTVPIAGGYVWHVVSEDGENKSFDDAIVNVFVHRSTMMLPTAQDVQLVAEVNEQIDKDTPYAEPGAAADGGA